MPVFIRFGRFSALLLLVPPTPTALLGLGPNREARHSTGKVNEIMQLPSAPYRRNVKNNEQG